MEKNVGILYESGHYRSNLTIQLSNVYLLSGILVAMIPWFESQYKVSLQFNL